MAKINISCEEFKPYEKGGKSKAKCHCKYLNRNFHRDLKMFKMRQKADEALKASKKDK